MRASLVKAVTVAASALAVALFTACGAGGQYTQVTAGGDFTCGLRGDGSVVCWGSNEWGQLSVPEDERFTAIEAGGLHACGLRSNGTTVCWGYHFNFDEDERPSEYVYPQPFPPGDEKFEAISANGIGTCGIHADGSVKCWEVPTIGRLVESSPFGAEQVEQVSAGGFQVCGLRTDGSILCSVNTFGILSDGEGFVSISTAPLHVCGLHTDGSVFCWGTDMASQLLPPEEGPFSAVAAGTLHTCALRVDGSPVCWGYDLERAVELQGPSGSGPPMGVNAPQMEFLFSSSRIEPPEDEQFTAIDAGSHHTCGLRNDGGISCWGYNHLGQATPPGARVFQRRTTFERHLRRRTASSDSGDT